MPPVASKKSKGGGGRPISVGDGPGEPADERIAFRIGKRKLARWDEARKALAKRSHGIPVSRTNFIRAAIDALAFEILGEDPEGETGE